jgi:hypothetical protein
VSLPNCDVFDEDPDLQAPGFWPAPTHCRIRGRRIRTEVHGGDLCPEGGAGKEFLPLTMLPPEEIVSAACSGGTLLV